MWSLVRDVGPSLLYYVLFHFGALFVYAKLKDHFQKHTHTHTQPSLINSQTRNGKEEDTINQQQQLQQQTLQA